MEQINEEIWKDVRGYECRYQISNLGNIKSLPRFIWNGQQDIFVNGRILRQCIDSVCYFHVNLRDGKKAKTIRIHRLVALHFVDNPHGYKHVNHIDGNPLNNRADNLEWVSPRENISHFFGKKTGIVGVSWAKDRKKWVASIYIDKKLYNLGRYDTKQLASEAYQKALIKNNIVNRYAVSMGGN